MPRNQAARSTVFLAFAALVIGVALGALLKRRPSEEPPQWSGLRLGGPAIAMNPRISPDGQLLAFQTIVDGESQVAVMKPDSGNWTVLTHDRTHGLTYTLSWSSDGAKIYYDRMTDSPAGVFSVPALGGEERLVLENAFLPEPGPDGSLFVFRINAARESQLHRFWPATGRLQALPVMQLDPDDPGIRLLAGGKEVVYFGQPVNAGTPAPPSLYALDLESLKARPLVAGFSVNMRTTGGLSLPFAVRPEDGTVVFGSREGNLYRLFSVATDRGSSVKPLFTVPMTPELDAARGGTLYMSLAERAGEVFRFAASGGVFERVAATSGTFDLGLAPVGDGRVLIPSHVSGRQRVLVAAAGKEPVPLLDTDEDTAWPMTPVGDHHAALMIGSDPSRQIAIVSLADGRIVRRISIKESPIVSLAAAPDGKTLYYASSGFVWAMRIDQGNSQKVCPGDSVVVDPESGDLIVKLDETDRYRLMRIPASGGPSREIPLPGAYRLTVRPLTPGAVRGHRLALAVATTDSWFWHAAVIDLTTGKLEPLPVDAQTDFHFVTWNPDGRILALALDIRSALWRFRPVQLGNSTQ